MIFVLLYYFTRVQGIHIRALKKRDLQPENMTSLALTLGYSSALSFRRLGYIKATHAVYWGMCLDILLVDTHG